MNTLNTIIVDDDSRSIDLLLSLLEELDYPIKVSATFTDPSEALEYPSLHEVDLMFLDVEMPVLSGLELIDLIGSDRAKIILTTAHEEFALAAIKRNVSDYLLKPLDKKNLRTALKKVMATMISSKQKTQSMSPSRICVPTSCGFKVIALERIVRLEASNNYTFVYCQEEMKPTLVSKTLKSFEDMLEGYQFVRVNQSNVINLRYVDRFDRSAGGAVTLKNGKELLLGRVYRDRFLHHFSTEWV